MSVRRAALSFDRDFTRTPNEWVRDVRLSRKARQLLTELLSHREGFVVTLASLVAGGPEGRDAIVSGLDELRALGYLTVEQDRGRDGRFGEVEYVLSEPEASPLPDYPGPVHPQAVHPQAANPTHKKTKEKKTTSREDQPASTTLLDVSTPTVRRTSSRTPVSPEVEALCETFVEEYTRDDPGAVVTLDARARRGAEAMLRDYGLEESRRLIVFAFRDDWWRSRLTDLAGVANAREKLRRKMRTNGPGDVTRGQESDEPTAEEYQAQAFRESVLRACAGRGVDPATVTHLDTDTIAARLGRMPVRWRGEDARRLEVAHDRWTHDGKFVEAVPGWVAIPLAPL